MEIRLNNMKHTILGYVEEYGQYSFAEKPLNDVDSLILSQFAYLKFDGMVPDINDNKPSVSINELALHKDFEKLFADERYEKVNRALFEGMVKSRRFGKLHLNCYINMVEKEWQTQFSAVTFLLEDGSIYVAFRGTDETIIGWKEDFNMAFLTPVPGQSLSVKYLNMVTGKLHQPFYVGGHSKGGNLAIYSAMNCTPEVQSRIIKVYSMDGPGFRSEVLRECGYEKIADKVVKLLPHSSIVGMIFERDVPYRVVESNSLGLAQHDPYTWIVKKGSFIETKDIYQGRKFLDETINEWILSLDEKQLRTFIDTLYEVVSASQADDLIKLTADGRKSMMGMIGALKELDEETIHALKEIVKLLFEIAGARMMEETAEKTKQILQKGTKKRKS